MHYSENKETNPESESQKSKHKQRPTKVFCLRCPKKHNSEDQTETAHMTLEEISEGSVVISNANLELTFDEDTHLLTTIKDKRTNLTKNVTMVFGGYPTMQFRNGAYYEMTG